MVRFYGLEHNFTFLVSMPFLGGFLPSFKVANRSIFLVLGSVSLINCGVILAFYGNLILFVISVEMSVHGPVDHPYTPSLA